MNEFPESKHSNTKASSVRRDISSTNEEESSADIPLLPTPCELVALLSKHVVGHEQAKQDIAVAAYNYLLSCARSDMQGGKIETENHLMLVGPSGCGKSLLFRTLGQILKVPLFYFPCTNIAPFGYKGQDLTQHLDAISRSVVDEDYTHPVIVVWDEVDKLSDDGSVQGSYRRTVQQDFLTYLDGTMCGSDLDLDSSRILNFACGAFAGLDEIRDSSRKPVIGFKSSEDDLIVGSGAKMLPPLCPEHLIEYGMIPEFVGRFSRLSSLEPLDSAAMRRILLEAESNVLSRRKAFFALHGIRLELTDDAIDAVMTMAMHHLTGARSLGLILDQVLKEVEHRLPDLAQQGVTSLVYDREAVLGHASPTERTCAKKVSLDSLFELRRKAASYTKRRKPPADSADLGIF